MSTCTLSYDLHKNPFFIHTVQYNFSKLFWGAFTDHSKRINLVYQWEVLSRRALSKLVYLRCMQYTQITHVTHLQQSHLYIVDRNVLRDLSPQFHSQLKIDFSVPDFNCAIQDRFTLVKLFVFLMLLYRRNLDLSATFWFSQALIFRNKRFHYTYCYLYINTQD